MISNPFDRLDIGQIVHYVAAADSNEPGRHWPAIVTRVVDATAGVVSLTVFSDRLQAGSISRTNMYYSERGEPGTWHFAADDALRSE